MPRDGRTQVGDILPDWQCRRGYVTEVVAVHAGKLPTPIDIYSPRWGSSAESCALHGGSVHHDAQPARGAGRKGHL